MTYKETKRIVACLIVSALSISLLVTGSNFLLAQAVLIEPEEHWKYIVDSWKWDEDMRRNHGIIKAQAIILNETEGRIDGYVADANGTRLSFYDEDQVVMVKFVYNNGGASDWELVDRIRGGNFTIDIPSQHREASKVAIYIGGNQYTVNDGTDTTPQTWVFVNSVRTDYNLTSTVQQPPETELAQTASKPVAWSKPSSDSLIDRILMMFS